MTTYPNILTSALFSSLMAVAVVLAGCSSSSSSSDNEITDNEITIDTTLDGTQSVPAVPTRASGIVNMTLNRATGELSGSISHSVTNVTVAHVHTGAIGATGSPIVNLESTQAGEFVVPAGTILTADQITAFANGELYVNVHSSEFTGGEIRAQLTNDAVSIPVLASLDDIQAKVFTPICSGCHSGNGDSLPGAMNLTTGDAAFTALIGVTSTQEPTFERVAAGDGANSYIVKKIEGTQSVGSQMPQGGPALSSESIAAIRQWIDDGAARQ